MVGGLLGHKKNESFLVYLSCNLLDPTVVIFVLQIELCNRAASKPPSFHHIEILLKSSHSDPAFSVWVSGVGFRILTSLLETLSNFIINS